MKYFKDNDIDIDICFANNYNARDISLAKNYIDRDISLARNYNDRDIPLAYILCTYRVTSNCLCINNIYSHISN